MRGTSANRYGYAHAVRMLVYTLSGPSSTLLVNARRGTHYGHGLSEHAEIYVCQYLMT